MVWVRERQKQAVRLNNFIFTKVVRFKKKKKKSSPTQVYTCKIQDLIRNKRNGLNSECLFIGNLLLNNFYLSFSYYRMIMSYLLYSDKAACCGFLSSTKGTYNGHVSIMWEMYQWKQWEKVMNHVFFYIIRAPVCTMGRRQAIRGSMMLWAVFCWENLGAVIHVMLFWYVPLTQSAANILVPDTTAQCQKSVESMPQGGPTQY